MSEQGHDAQFIDRCDGSEMLALLASLRSKVKGRMDLFPGVAPRGLGQPRANFRNTFGVVSMPRYARKEICSLICHSFMRR